MQSITNRISLDTACRSLALALLALLPLHTVFVRAWVAWKPWLVILIVLLVLHTVEGVRTRRFPWDQRLAAGLAVFLAALAVGWPADLGRFAALWLAIAAGGAVMLVVHRELTRRPGMLEAALRTIWWSAAALGATAVLLSFAAIGTFGPSVIPAIEGIPGVFQVTKEAYLDSGFVALTNWHSDPGYAAAWMNLWAVLAFVAWRRGLGSSRWWVNALVIGNLAFGVLMTLSRTGTLGLIVGIGLASWLSVREGASLRRVAGFMAAAGVWTVILLSVALIADRPGVGGDLPASLSFRFAQGVTLGPGFTGGEGTGIADPDYRGVVWPQYIEFFRSNPVIGVGLGHGWASENVQEPHNLILQLVGETGIVGLAGFAVLFTVIIRGGVGRLGLVALATTLAPSMTQTVVFEPTWWLAAGLASAQRHAADTS